MSDPDVSPVVRTSQSQEYNMAPALVSLCLDFHMTSKRPHDASDGGRPGERRKDGGNDDAPASRPDDEVPANRREAPQRGDQNDEQEHRDRRGS